MSDEDKLTSGKYTLVRVDLHWARWVLTITAVLSALLLGFRKWDLTFDTQEQKQTILNGTITAEERKALILLQDRQSTIYNDVKEIKGILLSKEK
jgi:hypothetical protein